MLELSSIGDLLSILFFGVKDLEKIHEGRTGSELIKIFVWVFVSFSCFLLGLGTRSQDILMLMLLYQVDGVQLL